MDIHILDPLDARIPKWDLGNLHERHCPFCETYNVDVLKRPDKLPVAFCGTCGCWYVSNLPPQAAFYELYNEYYVYHRPSLMSDKIASQMIINAKNIVKDNWQIQALSKLIYGLKGKRILEVGCGLGNFLLLAATEGAEVIGCDLSPEACEFVRKKLGLNVYCSTLESCSLSIGKVDAVVMQDLIEHPIEPMAVIRAAYDILKPKGVILIHTPNGGEAGINMETGKEWVGFRVDLEHLQYLSSYTVNWLSQKLDMYIERLDAFDYPGLKGINKLPIQKKKLKYSDSLRNIVKRISYMRTIVKTLRVVKSKVNGENRDPRFGAYHLFTILRKR